MPKYGLTIGMAIEKQSSNFEVMIPSSHGSTNNFFKNNVSYKGTNFFFQTDGVFVYLASQTHGIQRGYCICMGVFMMSYIG